MWQTCIGISSTTKDLLLLELSPHADSDKQAVHSGEGDGLAVCYLGGVAVVHLDDGSGAGGDNEDGGKLGDALVGKDTNVLIHIQCLNWL